MSSQMIPGPVLLGFGDFFVDDIALGAAPKSPGKPAGKAPAARSYPRPPHNPTAATHAKVLAQAHNTAQQAMASAHKALQAAAAGPKKTAIHGIIGAAAAAGVLTPRQKAAVARHDAALSKSAQAGQAAHAAGTKASQAASVLAKSMLQQKAVADKLRGKKAGPTRIHGLLAHPVLGAEVGAILSDYYTAVGADPDPNNPGFLTDGSPDPAFAQAPAGTPGSSPDGSAPTPDALDTADSLPPPPPMNTHIPDMNAVGGIMYDGSRGTPDGFVLSYGLATRATDVREALDSPGIDGCSHHGFVFGRYWDNGPEKGIAFGDDLPSGGWNRVHGRHILTKKIDFDQVDPATAHSQTNTLANPNGVAYGPIVGNPQMKDFAGLRADDSGHLFWLPQEAPDWATFPLKQAAALTAQKEKAAADAAAKADAAAAAKAQADAAAAQAQQDAANALSESQATSEANVAATQQQTQAQQLALQQAQMQQQITQQRAAQEQQAGDLLLQQARQRMQMQPPPGADQGYDDQGHDDGSGDGGGDGGGEDPGFDDQGQDGFGGGDADGPSADGYADE